MPILAPRHVTYVPLTDLRPAERNPRRHDTDGIARSIRDHGIADVVAVVDERTGRTIAGHGRTAALVSMLAAGERCPDGLLVDDDGGWLAPVMRGWSSRSDAEADALLVRHNKLTEDAEWHQRELAGILDDLTSTDPELFASIGYSDAAMEDLLRRSDPDALGGQEAGADPPGDAEPRDDGPPGDVTCPACAHRFPLRT